MAEHDNFAEISFTNAVLLDVFGRYATNSEMAEFVADDGSISMRFRMINGVPEVPDSCEKFLSFMFALFECNPQSVIGRIYIENQCDMLREIVYRLAKVLEGFSDIRLILHSVTSDENNPEKQVTSHTETTIKRSYSRQSHSI